MDIYDFISTVQQYIPKFITSYCIVNGTIKNLNEIQKMGYDAFSLYSKNYMPPKLHRYYPNIKNNDKITGKPVNYSFQALKNNTVFHQTPAEFDDVYDSDINIGYSEYEHLRLIEYCRRCGLEIDTNQSTQEIGNILVNILHEHYIANGNLENVFSKIPESEIEKLSNKLFIVYKKTTR